MKYIALIALMIGSFWTVLVYTRSDCAEKAGPNVNWTGCDKSGANLAGANLTGAKLEQVNFSHANLSDANLGGAVLFGANLEFSNLSGANLKGANLGRSDLTSAIFSQNMIFGSPFGVDQFGYEPLTEGSRFE